MKTTATVALIFAAFVFWPFAVIWALNSLFALDAAYGFQNWLALQVLGVFVRLLVTPSAP